MLNRLREIGFHRETLHPVVSPVVVGLIVAFVIFGAGFTGTAERVLEGTLEFITINFGWLMVSAVAIFLLFCLWLAAGPHAHIRLGPDDSRPDYDYPTWFAMLFSAGMGIGLVFWGVAEPIEHFVDAPRETPGSVAAANDAMILSFHHWGLGPWAVYAIIGLSLAYFGFRHDLPLTVRSALYPLIGDRMYGWPGNVVDILAILGTMFGVATSLGLGVMQVNAGLDYVFDVSVNTTVQVWLIAIITAIATVSVFTGLDRGIRRLSQFNLSAAGLLTLFVAVVGPTALLARAYIENLGGYAWNFLDVLSWTGTYDGEEWLGEWTLFYWAWWISWSPFVGMFIARISRGRTIREFVLGVLLVPTLVSFLWFTVFGNTGLHFEMTGTAPLAAAAEQGSEFVMFAMLDAMPLALVTSMLAVVVIVVFFVTSSDSGSLVIGMIASGGSSDPPRAHRVFWAITEGLVAAVLLLAGGLTALRAGAVSTGLPFTLVLLVVMVGVWKGLRTEQSDLALRDLPGEPLIEQEDDEQEDEENNQDSDGGGDGDAGTASAKEERA